MNAAIASCAMHANSLNGTG